MHGVSRDLPVVKEKISEGLVAKLPTVGIVRIVVILISESSGAFLQNSQCVSAHPALGRTGPPGLLGRMLATVPFCFLKYFLI